MLRRGRSETFGKRMSKIAYIRIATYIVLILAAFASRDRIGYLPLELPPAFCDDTELFTSDFWSGPASEFLDPKRSIPDVISLARELAKKRWQRADEPEWPEPRITDVTLRKSEGRIIWSVNFYDTEGGPFGISIDDLTGVPVSELRKNSPNKRPDGTSAEAPPSKPSQGAAVPHP